MNVLMLTTNLDLPEAHLIVGLKEKGIKIKLIMHPDSPFQEVVKESGIEIAYWNFKGRVDLKSVAYLKAILNKEKFDVIHTFSARALTSAILASLFKPVKIVTYRGTTGHLSRFDPTSWLSYLNPKVDKIICVSDAVKNYLSGMGIARDKLVRIYKGHNEKWYNTESTVSRHDFALNEDEFLIACSANMRPVKGVDLLIKAFEFIPAELNIKAILIGEVRDQDINKLLKNADIRKRIVLTGFRKDAAKIVSFCDAFCMPSRKREGLPKALIEAMIQAKPSIVTNVGGMPELVSNQEHGLVVEEENPAEIAKAILYFYNNREIAQKLGNAARDRIVNQFSIENTIESTAALYKEMLT